jgi:hypothetical protein
MQILLDSINMQNNENFVIRQQIWNSNIKVQSNEYVCKNFLRSSIRR